MPFTTGDNNFATAKWIVSPTAGQGTHTTITDALTAASSGDTIAIKQGTYTENLTLKAGVYLVGWTSASVTIVGKSTATGAGAYWLQDITLQTNGDFILEVSGSAATVLILYSCVLNGTNSSIISHSSSSASSTISLSNCQLNLATTGIATFISTSPGTLRFGHSTLNNTGVSTTASTISAGSLIYYWSDVYHTTTTTSTASIDCKFSLLTTTNISTVALTHGGSGTSIIAQSTIISGTATALTITATLTCSDISVSTSNATSLGGAGTIIYDTINFFGTTSINSVTTKTSRMAMISSAKFGDGTSSIPSMAFVSSPTMGFYRSGSSTIGIAIAGLGVASISTTSLSSVTTSSYTMPNAAGSDISPTYGFTGDTGIGMYRSAADTLQFVTAGAKAMTISPAGEITKPLQPAFLATASAQANVTGDATIYNVIFDTEIFDQNSDFDGTSTFTAPVTGRYLFSTTIGLTGVAAASIGNFSIVTSNRTQVMSGEAMGIVKTAANGFRMTGTMLIDMDAADICFIAVQVSGGAKTVGIEVTNSTFSGFLAC